MEAVFLLGMFSVAMLALGSRNMPGLLPEPHGSVACRAWRLILPWSGETGRVTLPSAQPELTFACELDPTRLAALFADSSVIEDLLALRARVALMVSDFSDERAGVVRRLNSAGIPVVGIPLLPLAEGYYFTADNAAQAAECYQQWRAWTGRHGLAWVGVGLDIEPDARIYLQIMDNPWGLARMLLPRLFDRARPDRSRAAYRELVDRIRADGWAVENYQFPLIADERRAGSTSSIGSPWSMCGPTGRCG